VHHTRPLHVINLESIQPYRVLVYHEPTEGHYWQSRTGFTLRVALSTGTLNDASKCGDSGEVDEGSF